MIVHQCCHLTVLLLRLCVPNWTLRRPLPNAQAVTAVALALAAVLDPRPVAVQPAAARELGAILGTLAKRTQRSGKLAVVKLMTTS